MRFGIFYEHQCPRPWDNGKEARIIHEALEQVQLADRLGFDMVWEVQHHFVDEYSHSSAPEVFLGACAATTKNIGLGHGIVPVLPGFNHPARVAEQIATLDIISNGRVQFGTGESTSRSELDGFEIDGYLKREMWEETVPQIARMMAQEPYPGYQGKYFSMPPRNVVPKPIQKPHPPVWVACSRRETIHLAGTRGIGALSFAFLNPEEARPLGYRLLRRHRGVHGPDRRGRQPEPRGGVGLHVLRGRSVNLVEVIHRSSDLFPTVDNRVDNRGGRRYFHWVETTNPPAMKPKPTTMFQLPNASTGRLPWVT